VEFFGGHAEGWFGGDGYVYVHLSNDPHGSKPAEDLGWRRVQIPKEFRTYDFFDFPALQRALYGFADMFVHDANPLLTIAVEGRDPRAVMGKAPGSK
jgi:hypothetical protein